ncbi:MAG: glycosyltransferase [Gemmatimonadetes bacterium]|nr:glycosyltransferase [Gemmatimonadota bacterium]
MRVVMVAHSFPRTEGDVAGAFLWRFAEALVERGHRVLVIAPADRGEVGTPVLGHVDVRRVRYASPSRETLAYEGTMHRLAGGSPLAALAFVRMVRAFARAVGEECRAGDVHLIHAHWWVPGGVAVSIAQRHGRPFVITLHGTDVALARKIPGGRRAMGAVLRRAAAVTAVSSYLADAAASASGKARDAIAVTPMPLVGALPPQTETAVRRGVVFVGRLTRQKGVHDLLDALALLKKDGLTLELTIVGDGPERAALKAQALALNLPATFVGFVAPELVASHVSGKRLLVLPSVDEGLGLVVAEALTLGVPVVATHSGGIPDLLTDPRAGLLVPPSNPPSLAAAIKTVATEEGFLRGAAQAGRALAQRLSPARVADDFEEVYLRARGGRRSASGSAKVVE